MSVVTIPLTSIQDHTFPCNETHPLPDESYLEPYRFRHWSALCDDDPLVLSLSAFDVKGLREDAVVIDRLGRSPHPEKIEDWPVFHQIYTFVDRHPEGVFVKVAEASPKDVLEPLYSIPEIWCALVTSRRVLTFLVNTSKGADLVLRPWNPHISSHNEYRVFVRDQKVVGISQQHLYQVIKHDPPHQIWEAVNHWVENHVPLPQNNAVLDVFYHQDTIHFIEANPWYYGSGSALFRWSELIDPHPPRDIRVVD